jgi:PAS domain-containing protein
MNRDIKILFIFVSGAMGEEVAIEAVKHGATDYVLKKNLLRLGPSVTRALEESDERKRREEAELSLQRSEANFHSIFRTAATLIVSVNNTGFVLDCNSRSKEILGYESEEIIGTPISSTR